MRQAPIHRNILHALALSLLLAMSAPAGVGADGTPDRCVALRQPSGGLRHPAGAVTRMEYAVLLAKAFGGRPSDYLRVPHERWACLVCLTREQALFLLCDKAMDGLHDVVTDMDALSPYRDRDEISDWAKGATAYAIQTGIFAPEGDRIHPKRPVAEAEVSEWVKEARYPLYTFLTTNDFHGRIETGKLAGGLPVGGAAYNMAYIGDLEASNPLGTLLLDGGDIMQGPPVSNLLRGESTIDVYNHMGYRAAVAGNHEFDWGLAVLRERVAQAQFPVLLANVFDAGADTRPGWMTPSTTLTVKGQQVGIVGVISQDTPHIVMAGNVAGLDFRAPGPVVVQMAARMRAAGADLVVVLAHMPEVSGGAAGGELAEVAVPGVDLVVAGHSHAGFTGQINGIPVIEQYSSGMAIGVSELRYDRLSRRVASSDLQVVVTYDENVAPDAGIAALVAGYQAEVAPLIDEVEASTLGPIGRGANEAGESPLGTLVADAQRWRGGTQIAFTNPGGGIPASIEYQDYPHDITYGDFLDVQPYDNKLVTMTMTGGQIRALLEQQFPPTQPANRVLPVSGIRYSFDLALPAGSRVTALTLSDGAPIGDDTTSYTVTVNEYLATGGDRFSAFLGGADISYLDTSDLEALVGYVQSRFGVPPSHTAIDPAVYPTIEGRITRSP